MIVNGRGLLASYLPTLERGETVIATEQPLPVRFTAWEQCCLWAIVVTIAITELWYVLGDDLHVALHDYWRFALVAGPLLVADLTIQKRYTRKVRAAMEGTAKSRFIPSWLHPNAVTTSGVVLCVAAAFITYFEHRSPKWMAVAITMFFVGAMLDVLDGSVARATGKSSLFGEFFDSITDRMGEAAMLIVFALLFAQAHNKAGMIAAMAAIVGSFLVSYARAKAKMLGLQGKNPDSGVARRAERCAAIIAALVWMALGWTWSYWVYLMVFLVWVTVVQRSVVAYQESKRGPGPPFKTPEEYWDAWPDSSRQ